MSGPETLRERVIGLERKLDENNLKSMREIALAVADGDQIFAASLWQTASGLAPEDKTLRRLVDAVCVYAECEVV